MMRRSLIAALVILYGIPAAADEQRTYSAGRGELLYSTHCVACHNAQVHWRDRKLVTDWPRLRAEVGHWEGFSRLGWTDEDVTAVAKYLNTRYYHHASPD